MSAPLPKISVVLPVRYVNEGWLRQSIESVLNQDYPNKELIVVNDEATKPIDDLVASYGIAKYVKNDCNRKLPYSLNRGFERADGEFHTWTSADNVMLPGMLTRLARELEQRPEAEVVFHRSRVMDEHGELIDEDSSAFNIIHALVGIQSADTTIPRCFTYFSTLGACFLYRADVWKRLQGYDEAIPGAEDYDFWIRATRTAVLCRVPFREDPLYCYRNHKHSMSASIPGCFREMRVRVLERERALYPGDRDLERAISYYSSSVRRRALTVLALGLSGRARTWWKQVCARG